MTKTSRSRFRPLAPILVAAALGLGGGYALWGRGDSADAVRPGATMQHEHEAQVEAWTCSMHPQIRLPKPGKCPICGMDLIPAASNGGMSGLRRLTIRPEQQALMRLRTVPVERRFPDAKLRLVGKVTYDETRLGYITAWVPGRIDDLYVDFTGVTLRKGDHMVKLYSPELYTAQQELLQAKLSLIDLQRSELKSMRDAAQGTIDSARERLRLWGLTAEQIAGIESRGTPEEHVTIYAPSSGLVIHRNAQEGMYVQTGTRIFTIADLSQVWVQLDAYETDLEWLRYGQEVVFQTEAYGGQKFTGRISFIDPVLDRRTRTVKVRVNVPNPNGLLKPDMFVHATVHARIAAGGKVMDPSLAGKWISPMHPEIIKDAPGKCDVCGMDLVPAEKLGYVPANRVEAEAPLVVPVSATLMTGTRAIVYVELPDMPQPTYEGREVVLGPRAGDDYIVLNGIKEGELVVAEGNFKIDSALQLQAKPSMMSPAGGQASGGHHHGGADAKKMEMPSGEMDASMLSEAARARLQVIERTYASIAAAAKSGDLEEIRNGFSGLAEVVKKTDMALFTGRSHEMWMELSMRLSNDAFEGTASPDVEAAAASLKKLGATVQMMRKHFGTTPEAPAPKPVAMSTETRSQLESVWAGYTAIHGALAADNLEQAKAASAGLANAATKLEATAIPESGRVVWRKAETELASETTTITQSSDIAAARAAFERLSLALEEPLKVLRTSSPVYVMHCPMAFDGRGARWLQGSEEVVNPYFGASMLHCGSSIEVLKSREASRDK